MKQVSNYKDLRQECGDVLKEEKRGSMATRESNEIKSAVK